MVRTFIAEIDNSTEAKRKLLRRNDDHSNPAFTVRSVDCFERDGYVISRLRPKFKPLSDLRILFAIDNEYGDFYVLAVARKSDVHIKHTPFDRYDYEPDHPISKRIRDDYDELEIPGIHHR